MTALLDLDGVIFDTEPQYEYFWDRIGMEYFGIENFEHSIKGQTLVQIFDRYFAGLTAEQEKVTAMLNDFEAQMSYDYVPGALEFMTGLKAVGIPFAIVTSSNRIKMSKVRRAHPELWEIADAIITSEDFSKSKPDPECFLKGMEVLGGRPSETYVFEDSIHGINAGRASGAHVIGLATTLSRDLLEPLCEKVIDNFVGFSLK